MTLTTLLIILWAVAGPCLGWYFCARSFRAGGYIKGELCETKGARWGLCADFDGQAWTIAEAQAEDFEQCSGDADTALKRFASSPENRSR